VALSDLRVGAGGKRRPHGHPGSSLLTFEDNAGYPALVVDGWVTKHLARQFSHLPYNAPSANTMTNYINLAASRNVGWIYVTDDTLPNPWDTLPAYWTNEVNYIRSLNQSAPATELRVLSLSNGVPSCRFPVRPAPMSFRRRPTWQTGFRWAQSSRPQTR
jgi:hypothetical protein